MSFVDSVKKTGTAEIAVPVYRCMFLPAAGAPLSCRLPFGGGRPQFTVPLNTFAGLKMGVLLAASASFAAYADGIDYNLGADLRIRQELMDRTVLQQQSLSVL